jgi:hypothetical protein
MKHLRVALLMFAVVTAFFFVVSMSIYVTLKSIIGHSQFRLAVAMNAGQLSGKRVSLIVGDSRMMDGIDASRLSGRNGLGAVYNAAFNGVHYYEALATAEGFIGSCRCQLNKVLIDETSLWQEEPGVSETEVFLAAFLQSAMDRIRSRDPKKAWFLRIFPALHFNNEVTLRSLYYLILNRGDQDQGNSYRFRLPKNRVTPIGAAAKVNRIDKADIKRLIDVVAGAGGKVIVVIPPHHPAYTDLRLGYAEYIQSVRQTVLDAGASFQDDSRLFVDHPDYFSDLIHLHTDGQAAYVRHLAEGPLLR